MSEGKQLPLPGLDDSDYRAGGQSHRASLGRELLYLLTINTQARIGRDISKSGLAYSISICLLEASIVARGKGGGDNGTTAAVMPRFVDVKLTTEQRAEFADHVLSPDDCVKFLMSATDDGYRIGVTWSGEHQAYTVSMTCRNTDSPNNGQCMTSFAGNLVTAISLASYKHHIVTKELWSSAAVPPGEEFG